VTQALYRRYRPSTFDEVIGQGHVTTPLRNALSSDRTHHAYLFSGPRGCGKTTSARILARCLNCEQGPTPTPCGVCQSCQDLGPGGAGSLDVIEIDAASHGGVDDARDLRERAFYAPASSRFKVYIIDEAHMVSREGFNALLKLVEEPPEHVKFVFATTEPDKVIATIRSRTHHYPFRLVPPTELQAHLAGVCEQEKVVVDPAVLSLVVRAGRGSVRDSLSVLDQLLAGAGADGLTYSGAAALLGYTDASLLDDTIDAFAAGDAAAVFRIVDQVVEGGHDPRRFTEDLLERLRDLIVIDAVPDAAGSILGEHPDDELERMRQQAAHFGRAELSRAADVVNAGLTEMRGATAPRLHLELIVARVMLPAADHAERGFAARLDRLERRLATGPVGAGEQPAGTPSATRPAPTATPAGPATVTASAGPAEPAAAEAEPAAAVERTPTAPEPTPTAREFTPIAPEATPAAAEATPAATPEPASAAAADPAGGVDLITVRRMWPDVLDVVKGMRRFTWTLLSHNAQVAGVANGRLTLSMVNAGARDSFTSSGSDEIVRQALITVLAVDWKVDAVVDPSADPAAAGAPAGRGPAAGPGAQAAPEAPQPERPAAPSGRAAAMAAVAEEAEAASGNPGGSADDAPSADDPDADETGLSSQDLLARELGAKVIGEYDAS
jgi:DNA polymerase-3 subunit gamma/tau